MAASKATASLAIILYLLNVSNAFAPIVHTAIHHSMISITSTPSSTLFNSPENNGVIDLTDDDDDTPLTTTDKQMNAPAPFLSQGELSSDPNLLSPDFKDPKQTRVIIYIILTLVPILFLVPLMIGSRDLIPLDILPPVELN